MSRFALTCALLMCTAIPAWADTANAACWSPGTAPALFDWRDAPSLTCRTKSLNSPDTAPTATTERSEANAPEPTRAPRTEFFLTGEVYVGVAATF